MAMREMGRVGLLDALDYCALLAVERSERFEPAAVRWLSVLLSECGSLTLEECSLRWLVSPVCRLVTVRTFAGRCGRWCSGGIGCGGSERAARYRTAR
jgi:hypothetical protein